MSTTIDEAIKHLDNMVKLLKEFKKEVKAQKLKPSGISKIPVPFLQNSIAN